MSGTEFGRYDTADSLKNDDAIAAYLEAAMEEGGDNPAYILHALGVVARARNVSKLAREAGLSREGLYKALSGKGNPSFFTVMKVASALGLRISVTSPRPQENASA
ncbi:MAG: putative addiction module antidote protein [Betaproteobacteria bacterium]|nr:putative addiction module antidote protein [Betaproteobacteria bacterium]